jgi:ribonucleoside-triphosphate reductase
MEGYVIMLNVKKRNGEIVAFDITKIEKAIEQAFKSVKREYSKDMLELLALRVTANFTEKNTKWCYICRRHPR